MRSIRWFEAVACLALHMCDLGENRKRKPLLETAEIHFALQQKKKHRREMQTIQTVIFTVIMKPHQTAPHQVVTGIKLVVMKLYVGPV